MIHKWSDKTYYSLKKDKEYCSASQYLSIVGRPIMPGCETKFAATLKGLYKQEATKDMLIGSIVDTLWELEDMPYEKKLETLADKFPECISTKGATKGQVKAEYVKAIELYNRTKQDELFCKYMSGKKQVIMTGEIEGLPFKIKMDSYIKGKAIVDLKTTQDSNPEHRIYVPDTGWVLAPIAWGYDTQLAIYREIVRQNTGETLPCFLAMIDKKAHPKPTILRISDLLLDDAIVAVKANVPRIKDIKEHLDEYWENGSLLRCEECDYCRDTYKCKEVILEPSGDEGVQR